MTVQTGTRGSPKMNERLDKAKKRADAEYHKSVKLDPEIAKWNKKTRKSFLKRKKDRERAQRKFNRQKKRTYIT